VLRVVGQQKILGQIDLDAVAFPDGDGWEQVQEPVQNVQRRLREARRLEYGTGSTFADQSGLRKRPIVDA
jgi:hypothetical protein